MTPDGSESRKYTYVWVTLIIIVAIAVIVSLFLVIKHKDNALPPQYYSNRSNFSISVEDASKATDELNNNNNTALANTLILQSIASSKKVSDAFLDYLSPQLKNKYRNNLIQGEKDYYQGVKEAQKVNAENNPGTQLQEEGIKLEADWINWWKTTYISLYNKAYPTTSK